jgi:hypothetical protein
MDLLDFLIDHKNSTDNIGYRGNVKWCGSAIDILREEGESNKVVTLVVWKPVPDGSASIDLTEPKRT